MSVFGWSWEVEAEEAGGEDAELEQDDGNAGSDDDSHVGADQLTLLVKWHKTIGWVSDSVNWCPRLNLLAKSVIIHQTAGHRVALLCHGG